MKFTVTIKTATGVEQHKSIVNVDAFIASACSKHGPCGFSVRPE